MPRDIKKLKELEQIINKKDLELAKYKQLVSSIQGLITINGIKVDEDNFKELLAETKVKSKTLEDYGRELDKDGYRLLIIDKKEADKIIKRTEEINKTPENVEEAARQKIKRENLKDDN